MRKRFITLVIMFFVFYSNVTSFADLYKADITGAYSYGGAFCGGVTVVAKDGLYAVIDIYGNIVVPFDEKEKFMCTNGLVKILGENNKFAYFDKYGNDVYTYSGECIVQNYMDGYMVVADSSGRQAVTDMNGNIIIPFDYSMKELAGGECFIIDQKILKNARNEITHTEPDDRTVRGAGGGYNVYPFIQTNIVAGPYHILHGLINSNGETILDTRYEHIYVYPDGLIHARTSEENYFYDYSGNRICTVHGNDMYYYGDGFLVIRDFDTKLWGYIANPIIYPKVYANGELIRSDVYARIENGRTLLPMRAIFESLGAEVSWNDETRTVTATKDNTVISLTVGEKILYKNDEPFEIDVPAKIENNRTLVPVRAVAEALECNVFWNEMSRQVIITS